MKNQNNQAKHKKTNNKKTTNIKPHNYYIMQFILIFVTKKKKSEPNSLLIHLKISQNDKGHNLHSLTKWYDTFDI